MDLTRPALPTMSITGAAPSVALTRLTLVLAPVLVILAVVAFQINHFRAINFRDDEIRTVHAAMTMSIPEVVQWMSVDIHPPLWRIFATSWVSLFGVDEVVARFSSVLTLALALALFYRALWDTFDGRVALLGLTVFGTHALVLYYGHELRPYAALLLWTSALHLLFGRWLRRPHLRYAALYVLAGAAALYTHFFAVYVIAAQAVALLALVRPTRGVYVRAFALFVLIGLAFTAWLPSFLHSFLVTKPGGVDYGIEAGSQSLNAVYAVLQVEPSPLANLLQGLAVLVPLPFALRRRGADSAAFRFPQSWPKWYWLIVAGTTLVGAFITNRWVDVLTQRNLVVIVPALAALTAIGLRVLPLQAALVALALLLGQLMGGLPAFERLLPFREVASAIVPDYEAGMPVIFSVDDGTGDHFAFAYTLMDRLPGQIGQDDMFILTEGQQRVNLPEPIRDPVTATSEAALARLARLVTSADNVWWVTSGYEPDHAGDFRAALERDFEHERSVEIPAGEHYPVDYRVDVYRRRTDS